MSQGKPEKALWDGLVASGFPPSALAEYGYDLKQVMLSQGWHEPGSPDAASLAHRFFEDLEASIRAPHTGDAHRATVRDILKRAEAVGLYSAPKETE